MSGNGSDASCIAVALTADVWLNTITASSFAGAFIDASCRSIDDASLYSVNDAADSSSSARFRV
jgi:hypothetical protein